MHSHRDHFIITLSLGTDVTDVKLGASGLWREAFLAASYGKKTLLKSLNQFRTFIVRERIYHITEM